MLSWALTFLLLALIAGVLGFTGMAGTAGQIAWIFFVVFLGMFVISLITSRRGPVVQPAAREGSGNGSSPCADDLLEQMEKSNVALNMIENANSPVIFFTFYNLRKPCIESSRVSSQTLQIRMIDREFPLCFQLLMVW